MRQQEGPCRHWGAVSELPRARSAGVGTLPEFQAAFIFLSMPSQSAILSNVIFDCLKFKYIFVEMKVVVDSF